MGIQHRTESGGLALMWLFKSSESQNLTLEAAQLSSDLRV